MVTMVRQKLQHLEAWFRLDFVEFTTFGCPALMISLKRNRFVNLMYLVRA